MNHNQKQIVVVGAGISGMKVAIDLAQQNFSVILVDKATSAGGLLARLDHQFPNNHCGLCRILPMIDRGQTREFCLRRGLFHDNITIRAASEVQTVTGPPGQLKVILTTRPTGVDAQRCNGCGQCEEVCPETVVDTFNAGLGRKKAIALPVPHLAANNRVIDWQGCTRCGQCESICPTGAISLKEETVETLLENVGAVVLASGIELYDPAGLDFYGYGTLKNVVTATDFERILSSSGPYAGKLVRPSDGREIKKIGWIQCVGSRNIMINADFCSSVCCMFAIKEAVLAQDRIAEADTAIFYMDMRTFGRDYQRYRDWAEKEKGVRFVRCRVHSVYPQADTDDLNLSYLDAQGRLIEEVFDLVVLSTGQKAAQTKYEWEGQEGVFRVNTLPGFKDIADSITGSMALTAKVKRALKGITDNSANDIEADAPPRKADNVLISAEKETLLTAGNASRLKAKRLPATEIRRITPQALVIGGGPAGLTAAKGIADYGLEVVLVERKAQLGGNLAWIAPDPVKDQVTQTLAEVNHHPLIKVLTESEMTGLSGVPGRFQIALKHTPSGTIEHLDCGTIILATGGRQASSNAYLLGTQERIITGFDLAHVLDQMEAQPDVPLMAQPPQTVAMIQCADSREEPHNYCSRVCCLKSLTNALRLKKNHPETDVYIFYRDMMTYGESEKLYTEARRQGVVFIPFAPDQKPVVRLEEGQPVIEAIDPLTRDTLSLKVDLLAVATGLVPHATDDLKPLLGFETTLDGFIQEADTKWRPVDTGREGVFVCGLAKGPLRLAETVLEAEAAAHRALSILEKKSVAPSPVSAYVRQALCSRCERCIAICPYHARYFENGRVLVDPLACQGCGACATECPNNATLIQGYEDDGIMNVLEALF